jgi:putative sigma-54 modulation protein
MSVLFTGRKTDLSADLKEWIGKKLEKLEPLLHETPDAHVILTREKHRHRVEIVVRARVGTLTATADGTVFEESLGLAVDRLLAQARKHHGKLARSRKRQAMRSSPRRGPRLSESAASRDGGEMPLVVPTRISVKPMSVEEALLLLQENSDPFLVFRDSDNLRLCVLFRRRDGRFGLIEPEI